MLDNASLESMDARLELFKTSSAEHQRELQTLLREYTQLLEAYESLKESSSLAHDQVGNANSVAPKTVRDPYVLVLVDGNGYIFNDELIKEKEEGGMRAARVLNEAVEKHIGKVSSTKSSRIVVRIYADYTELSKQLAKSKLLGLEKRSLSPFAAGFTRAMSNFDFIDALDEEGTRFKIRENFKVAADDPACTQILFAGCQDASYLPQLKSHVEGPNNKLTVIQGAGFNEAFYAPGFDIAQFPTVFRWSELHSALARSSPAKSKPAPAQNTSKPPARDLDNWRLIEADESQDWSAAPRSTSAFASNGFSAQNNKVKTKPCMYFQKGFCRWGSDCKFVHESDHLMTFSQSSSSPTTITPDRKNVSQHLPDVIPEGFIALNKDNHRLDAFINPPSSEEWLIYNTRFHKQKPCNSFHLTGACANFNCAFDHHPLEVESQNCLVYLLKGTACPRKGTCRDAGCYQGHICQKDGCMGQVKGCKMKADLHAVDPHYESMVQADQETLEHGLV